jgi:hypothetical protein
MNRILPALAAVLFAGVAHAQSAVSPPLTPPGQSPNAGSPAIANSGPASTGTVAREGTGAGTVSNNSAGAGNAEQNSRAAPNVGSAGSGNKP